MVQRAFYGYRAAVKLYDAFHHRKAETAAAVFVITNVVRSVKPGKYFVYMFFGDALAVVGNDNLCFIVLLFGSNGHKPGRIAVLYAVADQIGDCA